MNRLRFGGQFESSTHGQFDLNLQFVTTVEQPFKAMKMTLGVDNHYSYIKYP